MDCNSRADSDRVESETSITESQDDPPGEGVIDEEDDVEELRNSLKQIVQDEAVKPKLQCVMMDPSFSMVTVQSEDSGIVWETASSRCSTPWASEASSISDAYSLEGSGTQGKIVIIMDEDKIIRKRKKKSGRGKLGERLRRPSSRNFPGGNERPLMTEVSVPNVRPENTDENGESKMDKDQELFSLVSEGYEILNIVVPSRLPTVDEEESTELADNLSYLEENPRIKSTPRYEQMDELTQPTESSPDMIEIEEDGQVIVQVEPVHVEVSVPASTQVKTNKQTLRDGPTDMDYFEKFTLLDEHIPGESADAEAKTEMNESEGNETTQSHEIAGNSLIASDDTFVFVTDVEIASEHLDEVFYGNGHDDEHDINKQFETEEEDSMKGETLKCPMKESGSALFGGEETSLTPIFLPSGPPKIIDPILLEEPPAMSFHYSDLYEDAVGVRKKEEDASDVESVVSEKSLQRRLSDSDDASGYLEKFILKDETPVLEDEPVTDDPPEEGRLIWPQSKFELTGCLTRVEEEEDVREERENETSTERKSPSPFEDCEADTVIKISEHKTEDSQKVDLQGEVDVTGRKSPEVCHEVFEGQEEDVEKTVVEEKKEDESSQPSNFPADHEIEFKPEEPDSVKEIVTDTTEEVIVPKSPETTCEVPSEEKNQVKSDDALVDQEIDIMDQDAAPKITVVTPEELCVDIATETADVTPQATYEEVASGRETIEDKIEESAAAPGPESTLEEVVPEIDEIDRTEQDILQEEVDVTGSLSPHQEIVITQQEIVPDITVIKPEETCEEVTTDKEVVKEKLEESVDVQRTESVHEDFVTDSENIPMKAEQEHVDQESEATGVVVEPEEVMKDEIEEPEDTANEIITVSDISSGDVAGTDVENKDEVHLESEPQDDTYVATTEKELKEKHPVSAIGAREDLTEQDASLSASEQTSGLEPQLQHKSSADDEASLIKKKEEAIFLEDTGFGLLDDRRSSIEAVGETQRDQMHEGADRKLLNIHQWQRDDESKPDTENRERMLLRLSPLVMAQALEEEEREEDDGLRPPLRSFSPQEDLSVFGQEATLSAPEPFQFLHHNEEDAAAELGYEVITHQEARELPELETEVVKDTEAEELPDEALDSVQEVDRDQGLEADYEIIEPLNGIPLSEAELIETGLQRQSLDTFCLVCQCPISADGRLSREHKDHEVTPVEKAYEEIRNRLGDRIAVLQERSENVTDLVSELELAYNSVEEHCKASEQRLDEQNDEMMKLVMDQYNEMSQNMEEEKKAKLEQLYDRIVSFQESIDSAKEALEKSTKEIEETDPLTLVSSSKDINKSLTSALDAALSLELTPSAFPLFEDYAKNPSGNGRKELKGIPVPQKPHLQAQEPNSATSTSVTVYWRVNEGDIIDCFQVYCMEEPQGAVSEEYRVTVKESYCTLEELEADKCYKVWVMAVNYTGCSLPSEKLSFRTAPSVPVIETEKCTVCWDSAIIRWSPTHPAAVESYTLEYCRQYACEGEGLRSISGIQNCEQRVILHPNENYLLYIKAANAFGASEQSEAALVSTRGTRFHLLADSASSALELSEDRSTVYCTAEAFNQRATINECLGIQGELLPPRGYHYWETTVGSSDAYRIGVAYPTPACDTPLGENSTSWCIHCVPTATSCRFELLHDSTQTAIFTVEVPTRIGVLLDFLRGRLSFFNTRNGQLLGSQWHRFTCGCHPVLALERPGTLALHMVPEVPEFAKH